MYCRKCGEKISNKAKFCDACGEGVVIVRQRSDSQKYKDREKEMKYPKEIKKTKREKKLENLKNPYVIPALTTAVVAFGLGIFPWPTHWQVGTSLWMRVTILVIALLSDYHCTKARQTNRLYNIQYRYQISPKLVKTATILASITTMTALFSLVMM